MERFYTGREPDQYCTMKVAFGDRSAGVVTMTALRLSAEREKDRFPEAAELLANHSYVDDVMRAVPNVERAEKLIREADVILENHSFSIKSWVMSGHSEMQKVLGLEWHPKEDVLKISEKPFQILPLP